MQDRPVYFIGGTFGSGGATWWVAVVVALRTAVATFLLRIVERRWVPFARCLYLVILLGAPATAHAETTEPTIRIMGLGAGSCATWLQNPTTKIRGEEWVLGFLSGANVYSSKAGHSGMVSHSTDPAGLIAEVKKFCDREPSNSLLNAAGSVYFRFQKDNR